MRAVGMVVKVLAAALAAAAMASCGDTTAANETRSLDRPSGLAFACYGDLRIYGTDGVPDGNDDIVSTPMPIGICQDWLERLDYGQLNPPLPVQPEGQEQMTDDGGIQNTPARPSFYGFVLQTLPGTVALISKPLNLPDGVVVDADELTPGKNAIPVGVHPVDIATDPAGCHVVTANAGSCDLSVLEVASMISGDDRAVVTHVPVTASGGGVVLAKPAAMVGQPPGGEVGVECPASPSGLLWIAYPTCHTVAAVDSGSGEIRAAVAFAEDGTASITDGAVSCPAECGPDLAAPAASVAARPVTLALTADGGRLVIGAENANLITVVELDETGLPESLSRIPLEGDIGLMDVAVSEVIEQGGESGQLGGSGGEAQYVYAVATDGTVRVADIFALGVECDTQVDPRYIRDLRDVTLLSCFPVGDPETPPRRAQSETPGIAFVNGVPLDIGIVTLGGAREPGPGGGPENTTRDWQNLVGTFAFIAMTDGNVIVINVDDDNYPDFEVMDDPAAVDLQLGMAHQPRDPLTRRDELSEECTDDDDNPDTPCVTHRVCTFPSLGVGEGGPRQADEIDRHADPSAVAPEKLSLMPIIRHLACESEELDRPVSELTFQAPPDVREAAFPSWLDLLGDEVITTDGLGERRIDSIENWHMTWEGSLSLDTGSVNIDGPGVRQGIIDVGGDGMHILDGSEPFCRTGVEPYDIAFLRGCDASAGDAQCGVGETCYVHPDSIVGNGSCLPTEQVDSLAAPCRDFLISRRRYTVVRTDAGDLKLGERRRALRTTPIDGCLSADECQTYYEAEQLLISDAHPKDFELGVDPADQPSWACEADPTRAPGPDRCMMTCEVTDDCEEGFICSEGHCSEGVVPPRQCVTTLQHYELHGGETFVVIGERHGFLHDRMEDPTTGECVADLDANPLMAGRIPLTAPACTGDGLTDLAPNPCSTTVEHTENVPNYDDDDSCELKPGDDEPATVLGTRETTAIRFRNPALTFHLVDPTITGDAVCRLDRAGTLRPFPAVYPLYQFEVPIRAGFTPMSVAFNSTFAANVVFPSRVVVGPDRGLWVLDEGDLFASTFTTRGQVVRIDPRATIGGSPSMIR